MVSISPVIIPPDGVPAVLPVELPQPGDFDTIGGVKLRFDFGGPRPALFSPGLKISGVSKPVSDKAVGPNSATFISQFSVSVAAPAQGEVIVNESQALAPGTTMTVYAWSAQTPSGEGALNTDGGGEPTTLSSAVEVGSVEVVTWQEWNQRTDADQGGDS